MNLKLTFVCASGDELVLKFNHMIYNESRQHNTSSRNKQLCDKDVIRKPKVLNLKTQGADVQAYTKCACEDQPVSL